MKYAFLHFLPGSAGNFISRCVNLCDGTLCWIKRDDGTIPKTLEEKQQLFTYANRTQDNWTHFERQLAPYWQIVGEEHGLGIDLSFQIGHPTVRWDISTLTHGAEWVRHSVIDVSDPGLFEWAIMNAFYKQSYLQVEWFQDYHALCQDPSVYKISLENILDSEDSFWKEIDFYLDHLEISVQHRPQEQIRSLYKEWLPTTLRPSQWPQFKKSIGWLL